MEDIGHRYTERYAGRGTGRVYPVEFVVRAFLGSYPSLTMDKASYRGAALLDLGCGDGRNLPLLCDLGFVTHAVEITEGICDVLRARVRELGLDTVVKVGSNSHIPFADAYFDYVLCCHSLYYVARGETFSDNLRELARVVRPGGTVIASLPKRHDRSILSGAEDLGDNHVIIRRDPLGLRNGSVFKLFEDEPGIRRVFSDFFRDFQIGWMENDFFGIEEKLWIARMTRS